MLNYFKAETNLLSCANWPWTRNVQCVCTGLDFTNDFFVLPPKIDWSSGGKWGWVTRDQKQIGGVSAADFKVCLTKLLYTHTHIRDGIDGLNVPNLQDDF